MLKSKHLLLAVVTSFIVSVLLPVGISSAAYGSSTIQGGYTYSPRNYSASSGTLTSNKAYYPSNSTTGSSGTGYMASNYYPYYPSGYSQGGYYPSTGSGTSTSTGNKVTVSTINSPAASGARSYYPGYSNGSTSTGSTNTGSNKTYYPSYPSGAGTGSRYTGSNTSYYPYYPGNSGYNSGSSSSSTGSSTGSNKVTVPGGSTYYPSYPSGSGSSGSDSGSNKVTVPGGKGYYPVYPDGEGQCAGVDYPDDIDGHWAEIYIRRLYDLCVVEGYQDGSFRPNQHITRAELVKMALYAAGIAPISDCYDADCGSPFPDLDLWQGPWIRAAWNHGIVEGYRDGKFRPNQNITRAEAVKVVLATYGYGQTYVSDSYFKDVNDWSVGWLETAHNIGIVQGLGNGNFEPHRAITRGEAAKVIAKMIEYSDTKIVKGDWVDGETI